MRLALLLAAAAALAACGRVPIAITADASAVGARVLVDGKELGRLEPMQDGGRPFAAARLSAPRGERRFEIVAPDGRSVSGRVDVRGDVDLRADFPGGRLLGAKP